MQRVGTLPKNRFPWRKSALGAITATLRNPRDLEHFSVFFLCPVNSLNVNPHTPMLRWTLLFLVIAIIAGLLGFTGVAGTASEIAKILFFVFLVLLVISALVSAFKGRPPV